ncbi:ARS binding protein Abp2 [Purpureocillium lavendulum]|uniref:ARS binding protein Abp2 n=1 Tax=Purpureocillium lavendulum TaxID=1247861 RepID=A0AB34FKU8_9HYPO|nr:ARS binding protein Abp2 [Purpureocillium lavendulum]
MSTSEPIVSAQEPLPRGYGFLRKGNAFMTALCRRKTHAANRTLYVVQKKRRVIGLRAPKWILREVYQEERDTRLRRQENVEKRDASMEDQFRSAVERVFPKIPTKDLARVVKGAMQKKSGRVGRTGTLMLNEKARLAVAAHIRHCHTAYDEVLDQSKDRAGARKAVHQQVVHLMKEWGWCDANNTTSPEEGKRSDNQGTGPTTKSKLPRRPAASAMRDVAKQAGPVKNDGVQGKEGASVDNAIEISDSSAGTDAGSDCLSSYSDSEADNADAEWIVIEDSDS